MLEYEGAQSKMPIYLSQREPEEKPNPKEEEVNSAVLYATKMPQAG
jgi:hypothetical protein